MASFFTFFSSAAASATGRYWVGNTGNRSNERGIISKVFQSGLKNLLMVILNQLVEMVKNQERWSLFYARYTKNYRKQYSRQFLAGIVIII